MGPPFFTAEIETKRKDKDMTANASMGPPFFTAEIPPPREP